MGGNENLTAREFYKGIERIEARFDKRFDNVDAKIDLHGERIAVLEAAALKERQTARKRATAWGSAVAGVVMLAVEAFKAWKS